MNFGERLQLALQESNMSQAELSRRVGTTSQSVNGWCISGIIPRKEVLEKLPEVFGRPLYWFFMTDEEERSLATGHFVNTELNDRQKQMLAIFDQMPSTEQDNMIAAFGSRLKEIEQYVEEVLKIREKRLPK
ncbi:transcriptional repressor DicA [Serratia fonticola]|jgi:transcriptional regulator with XRE-family HTH domain|uniref:helix-turn-helix domain-containing protein n=1 Tax=Serratia fonticola TaxID=47917 RepID=UPI002178C622|nr:helix-turn-helix domain-containing protein [Serratia fonticola]CAI1603967.1 transcriptional repressor DicA [Serratia fonticola]